MEFLAQIAALSLALVLALVKGLRFEPNHLSLFELNRLIASGDKAAQHEQYRRQLTPTLNIFISFASTLISVGIAISLLTSYHWALSVLMALGYLLLAQAVYIMGWLNSLTMNIQQKNEARILQLAEKSQKYVNFFAKPARLNEISIQSMPEFINIINTDQRVLNTDQKQRLLAAIEFGDLSAQDVMVKRSKLTTVKAAQTVGPVLLDKLHKASSEVFPVIEGDINHIVGMLYMSDIVPLHPEIKKVKDALRSRVFYIAADESLKNLISSSLQTGRQQFIVVDNKGNTQGLVYLKDAIVQLLGEIPSEKIYISTNPKKVKDENSIK